MGESVEGAWWLCADKCKQKLNGLVGECLEDLLSSYGASDMEIKALPGSISRSSSRSRLAEDMFSVCWVEVINVGITNRLLKFALHFDETIKRQHKALFSDLGGKHHVNFVNTVCACRCGAETDQKSCVVFLLKYFGENTSLFINRKKELAYTSIAVEAGLGKKILASFHDGHIEEWVDGKTIDTSELRQPPRQKAIATSLARLHRIPIDALENKCKLQGVGVDICEDTRFRALLGEKGYTAFSAADINILPLWKRLWQLLALFLSVKTDGKLCPKTIAKTEEVDIQSIIDNMIETQEQCSTVSSPLVPTHGDMLSENILFTENHDGSPAVCLIDWEYANVYERAFDIANHFNEYAGFECNWQQFPSQQEQQYFLQCYAQTIAEKEGIDVEQITKEIAKEIPPYLKASHLFWAVWGLLQAHVSTIDFDFLAYAKRRLHALQAPLFSL